MTISDILSILGIIATVVFGVWGLIVVLRHRYPGEISFVREPYIGLFDSIVKNLSELSVQYNNKPVGQGLVLIKGALLNTGSKDITEPMVEDKLSFNLPSNFKWLTAKIVSTSPNVNASVAAEGSAMTFTTGLFRCSEFIRFEAIAEVPMINEEGEKHAYSIEEQLDRAITVKHRIADTKPSAIVVDLPNTRLGKQRVGRFFRISIIMTILVLASSFAVFIFSGVPAEMHFTIQDKTGTPIEVSVRSSLDGSVLVKGMHNEYREKLPADKFFALSHPIPRIVMAPTIKLMIFVALLYISTPWIVCAVAYRERRKGESLRTLLEIDDA